MNTEIKDQINRAKILRSMENGRHEGGWDFSARNLPDGTQYSIVEYWVKPFHVIDGDGPSSSFWIVPGTLREPPLEYKEQEAQYNSDLEDFHEEIRGAVLEAAEIFRRGGDVRDMHRTLAEGARRAALTPVKPWPCTLRGPLLSYR